MSSLTHSKTIITSSNKSTEKEKEKDKDKDKSIIEDSAFNPFLIILPILPIYIPTSLKYLPALYLIFKSFPIIYTFLSDSIRNIIIIYKQSNQKNNFNQNNKFLPILYFIKTCLSLVLTKLCNYIILLYKTNGSCLYSNFYNTNNTNNNFILNNNVNDINYDKVLVYSLPLSPWFKIITSLYHKLSTILSFRSKFSFIIYSIFAILTLCLPMNILYVIVMGGLSISIGLIQYRINRFRTIIKNGIDSNEPWTEENIIILKWTFIRIPIVTNDQLKTIILPNENNNNYKIIKKFWLIKESKNSNLTQVIWSSGLDLKHYNIDDSFICKSNYISEQEKGWFINIEKFNFDLLKDNVLGPYGNHTIITKDNSILICGSINENKINKNNSDNSIFRSTASICISEYVDNVSNDLGKKNYLSLTSSSNTNSNNTNTNTNINTNTNTNTNNNMLVVSNSNSNKVKKISRKDSNASISSMNSINSSDSNRKLSMVNALDILKTNTNTSSNNSSNNNITQISPKEIPTTTTTTTTTTTASSITNNNNSLSRSKTIINSSPKLIKDSTPPLSPLPSTNIPPPLPSTHSPNINNNKNINNGNDINSNSNNDNNTNTISTNKPNLPKRKTYTKNHIKEVPNTNIINNSKFIDVYTANSIPTPIVYNTNNSKINYKEIYPDTPPEDINLNDNKIRKEVDQARLILKKVADGNNSNSIPINSLNKKGLLDPSRFYESPETTPPSTPPLTLSDNILWNNNNNNNYNLDNLKRLDSKKQINKDKGKEIEYTNSNNNNYNNYNNGKINQSTPANVIIVNGSPEDIKQKPLINKPQQPQQQLQFKSKAISTNYNYQPAQIIEPKEEENSNVHNLNYQLENKMIHYPQQINENNNNIKYKSFSIGNMPSDDYNKKINVKKQKDFDNIYEFEYESESEELNDNKEMIADIINNKNNIRTYSSKNINNNTTTTNNNSILKSTTSSQSASTTSSFIKIITPKSNKKSRLPSKKVSFNEQCEVIWF